MTVLEALKQTLDILNGISVPVPQLQSIGMPISRATGMIQATIDALENNSQTREEPESEAAEPEESEQA